MTRQRSRAASVPKEDVMVTEVLNGLIVSRPAKRIEHLSTGEAKSTNDAQPKVWNLTKDGPVLESKAGSIIAVPGINKLKVIHNFIRSNGRI